MSNPFKRLNGEPRMAPEASETLRLPPNAPDAERGLLGCLLSDPGCADQIIRRAGREGDMFYDLRHARIWAVLMRLLDRDGRVDTLTLVEELRGSGQLEEVGGMTSVLQIQDAAVSPQNWPYYLDVVLERAGARATLQSLTSAIDRIYSQHVPWPELADGLEAEVSRACRSFRRASAPERSMAQQCDEGLAMMEQIEKGPAGFLTGYSDLDRLTMGLRAKQLIILAGRPGMGKSAFMLNIAAHNIWRDDVPVGFISLEMSAGELVNRIAGSRAFVDLQDVANWSAIDYAKFQEAVERLTQCNLHIDDDGGYDISSLMAKARDWRRRFNIQCLMVDYLQLVGAARRGQPNRTTEVGEVARGLKQIAVELDIPVIAGCAMNRELDRDSLGARPKLTHLRESGDIEAHADKVMTLYREAKSQQQIDDEDRSCMVRTGLEMLKQRGGRLDTIHFTFIKRHVRFELCSRVET